MRDMTVVLGALLAVAAYVTPVAADEAKTPVSASLLLNIMSSPIEPRQSAYDRSIKDEGPAPVSPWEGVVQPDGSTRYGSGRSSVTVTVQNPCPPGSLHYDPPPLPGRRARN
ncbi:MAG: hypothetical protein ACREM3_18030 [Candidatus Rokuibacteriota bacterium]